MKHKLILPFICLLLFISCNTETKEKTIVKAELISTSDYQDLVSLFHDWRAFENPPLLDGAPDYTKATFEKRWPEFEQLRAQLNAIDTTNWSIPNQVDWMIV